MQNWTTEMWTAAAIGLVVGVILAYILLRLTKGSVKKQVQTEQELKSVKEQIETQKYELEKHFAQSADLLKNLAQDYQKLYQHLAGSSAKLLPHSTQQPLFSDTLLTAEQSAHSIQADPDNTQKPKDYSEDGSSGLLKAER